MDKKQEFISVHCPVCKQNFGIHKSFYDACKRNKTIFYCPRGHDLTFPEEVDPHKADSNIVSLDFYRQKKRSET